MENTINTLPTVNELASMVKEQKISFLETRLLSTGRKGIQEIINFLRNTDFYIAPSSASHHSNYPGGLLDHSILVYIMAMNLKDVLVSQKEDLLQRLPDESIIISALLHDICKTSFYVPTEKWRKDASSGVEQWVSYQGYDVNDTFPIGHGEKSVIMLLSFGLQLTPDEMLAIRYHMGCWDGAAFSADMRRSYGRAMDMCPLMTLIQMADQISSLTLETKIN